VRRKYSRFSNTGLPVTLIAESAESAPIQHISTLITEPAVCGRHALPHKGAQGAGTFRAL